MIIVSFQSNTVNLLVVKINIVINLYGKKNFAEVSKNLARYRSENNFVGPSK